MTEPALWSGDRSTRVADLSPVLPLQPETGEWRERYHSLFDGAPVMICTVDDEGCLVAANGHWLETLGYGWTEVAGRPVTDFLTVSGRQAVRATTLPTLRTAGVVRGEEFQLVRRDGAPVEVLLSATARRAPNGGIDHAVAFLVDITERKRAERARRQVESRLVRTLEAAMDAIVIVDAARRVTFLNGAAEKMFGCAARDALGTRVDRFLAPEFEELIRRNVTDRSQPSAVWVPAGLTAYRADGEALAVEASVTGAEVDGEHHCTIILRDVDERHHAHAALRKLGLENVYLQEEIEMQHNLGDIVGPSVAMQRVFHDIQQVAGTDSTVLVTGETGTGKELVARAIHGASVRRQRVLVKVNCAALAPTLIESELFGHEKGAFTGASARRIGRFELADGGSIFLDEVGDLPAELQAKLLRVLQEGELERVGGTRTIRVDVRVIAATNRDLDRAVAEGRFRADLYYRLKVFPIRVPPLRERRDDVPSLVRYFIEKYEAKLAKRFAPVSREALDALAAYPWPGNVRELENVIERATIISRGEVLDLRDWLRHRAGDVERPRGTPTLDDVQREHIVEVLDRTGWRVSGPDGAAEILGIKPTTLAARMKKLGIERPPTGSRTQSRRSSPHDS